LIRDILVIMQLNLTGSSKDGSDGINSLPWHRLTKFYFIVSSFCIGISVLAIYSTMLISHQNLQKDDVQVASLTHLLQAVDWWNDYQAHKVREKIYNMELDNLNISLQKDPNPSKYEQQVFAKYLFLDKDLHDSKNNQDSLDNLSTKANASENVFRKLTETSNKHSALIITYELVTILFIVAASLAGISEIAKNRLLGYSAFCIGGIGCILLILAVTASITLPQEAEQGNDHQYKQPEQLQTKLAKQLVVNNQSISNSSSSIDFNKMYKYCKSLIVKTDKETCDSLFHKYN
jgi:hypothetical protein